MSGTVEKVPQTFANLVKQVLPSIRELMPWDADAWLAAEPNALIVDIREPAEFALGSIQGALNIPRGILEMACDWGYSDTVPVLAQARVRPVLLVCRSGNRSALAAFTLQLMGFHNVYSLQTGLRGWNDYELPLVTPNGLAVDADQADRQLNPAVDHDQLMSQ